MPGAGGCVFVHDPHVPIGHDAPLWLPEYSPGTVILQSAPPDLVTQPDLKLVALGAVMATHADTEGSEIIVTDASGELHIRLVGDGALYRPVFLMPIDAVFELRFDTALHLIRRLRGQRIKLLPAPLRLTPMQKMKLIQYLHAFDVHEAGGGPREVARLVLNSTQASLPSVEWKDSAARRTASRLIKESIALVKNKYLRLLRGG